ncbi:hypothetical protein CHU92_09485 [Flavobacterium cyanobacteriorum]|uniref:Uncharacterized protein n=2 Tax=Flavobacterium cyanobacteriorum TaxID=2022802 RepID=A0A255Z5B2_9FLAO|nr:hypothetical protein CHU92_09485 [Flavobacterium cyanobacteriorum]
MQESSRDRLAPGLSRDGSGILPAACFCGGEIQRTARNAIYKKAPKPAAPKPKDQLLLQYRKQTITAVATMVLKMYIYRVVYI